MSGGPVSSQQNRDTHPREQTPHLPHRPELSKDEIRTLKECSTESFWFRCVPLSIVLISASQYAVNKGYLTRHPKYGGLLKNIGAGVLGYVLGKFSYQGECRKKILALPESVLGDAVRKRKGIRMTEEMNVAGMRTDSQPIGQKPISEKPLNEVYSQMDMDSDKNTTTRLQGLDDGQRPSIDNEVQPMSEAESTLPAEYKNYDDLRNRNRTDSQQKTTKLPPPRTEASQDAFNTRPWPAPPSKDMGSQGHHRPPPPPERRQPSGSNKYGDVWDE